MQTDLTKWLQSGPNRSIEIRHEPYNRVWLVKLIDGDKVFEYNKSPDTDLGWAVLTAN